MQGWEFLSSAYLPRTSGSQRAEVNPDASPKGVRREIPDFIFIIILPSFVYFYNNFLSFFSLVLGALHDAHQVPQKRTRKNLVTWLFQFTMRMSRIRWRDVGLFVGLGDCLTDYPHIQTHTNTCSSSWRRILVGL